MEISSSNIHSLYIQNFKGFDQEGGIINLESDMNVLIGANNSGKSSVLEAIMQNMKKPQASSKNGKQQFSFGISTEIFWSYVKNERMQKIMKDCIGVKLKSRIFNQKDREEELKSKINASLSYNGCFYFQRHTAQTSEGLVQLRIPYKEQSPETLLRSNLDFWSSNIQNNEDQLNLKAQAVVKAIERNIRFKSIETVLIPNNRDILSEKTRIEERSLKQWLGEAERPSEKFLSNREIFCKITHIFQQIIQDREAKFYFSHDQKQIILEHNNKQLSLENVGTGIHEILYILAVSIYADMKNKDNSPIVLIEEPETHLHADWQRRLIETLRVNTKCKYIITSHSNVFIDTPGASLSHVQSISGKTKISQTLSPKEKNDILDIIGVKASDLLLSNYIIWVEGPSDRIYLNHWIQTVKPNLKEGIHYTIMHYAGSLISHIDFETEQSEDNETISDFIDLMKINRKFCFIIDRDKTSADDPLKSGAQRILKKIDTLENQTAMSWVTEGREVENYIPLEMLEEAIKKNHPNFKKILNKGKYDNLFKYEGKDGKTREAQKVKLARTVCKMQPSIEIYDLKEKIKALINNIEEANNLKTVEQIEK